MDKLESAVQAALGTIPVQQIKIFIDKGEYAHMRLEDAVNKWLADKYNIEVVSITYQCDSPFEVVFVVYRVSK